jgi:hypothetical protein
MIALGCAGPTQHGAVGATTAIQAAANAGAEHDPQGKEYLHYARNDLATANHYGIETDVGARALERSEANAELALTVTRHNQLTAEISYQHCKLHGLKAETCGTCTKEACR